MKCTCKNRHATDKEIKAGEHNGMWVVTEGDINCPVHGEYLRKVRENECDN